MELISKLTLLEFLKSRRLCIAFVLFLGQLIAGVNHEHKDTVSQNHFTKSSLCPPYDSCYSRCGSVGRNPYACSCDPQCLIYSDCCPDFQEQCQNVSELATISHRQMTCELILGNISVKIVTECSKHWKPDLTSKLCGFRIPPECVLVGLNGTGNLKARCESYVYSLCEKQMSYRCNKTLENKCSQLIEHHCKKRASAMCHSCKSQFLPTIDRDGILFLNTFCSVCNYRKKTDVIALKYKHFNDDPIGKNILRKCYNGLNDYCTISNSTLQELCTITLAPVADSSETNSYVFRNIFCAYCNGKKIDNLVCTTLNNLSGIQDSLPNVKASNKNKIKVGIQGLKLDDIPSAFSMLLNFGLDGRQKVYISSEGDESMAKLQQQCKEGDIWDPFSNRCRKLHCSTEFVLVNYQCVRKEGSGYENSDDEDIFAIPDAAADFVHLSFSVEMELLDFLPFYHQEIESISEDIRKSFAHSFNIDVNRIQNVKFNISTYNSSSEFDDDKPINFTISLDLCETSIQNATLEEPSVDTIVSMMASALSMNSFEFGIKNAIGRIYEMHQSVDILDTWCQAKGGGTKLQYWNSDFTLILNTNLSVNVSDQIKGIYINKTDTFYPKGQFIADILYQGYQFNQNLINVSGVAVVCEYKRLNESCTRIVLGKDEYSITENGTLIFLNSTVANSGIDNSSFEPSKNGSIVVCLINGGNYGEIKYRNATDVVDDEVQKWISFVLLCASVSAMFITLLTYCLFKSLRNLPGCNTMNLTFSLMAMQITYIFGQRNTVIGKICQIVGGILHYEILCCFMWMNVIAFDLYKTFGSGRNVLNQLRSKSKFVPRYMIYAYGVPLVVVVSTSLMDFLHKDSEFSPRYGQYDMCWITNKNASIAFFATPLAIVMVSNFALYMCTIFSISNVKQNIHMSEDRVNHRGKNAVFLYARMALVVGLTWALAFTAAFVEKNNLLGQVLTYLFIVFNTLQGLFIFIVFICNKRVYDLYGEAFRIILATLCSNASLKKKKEIFRKFPGLVERSVSKNTVISTVSNSSNDSENSMGCQRY